MNDDATRLTPDATPDLPPEVEERVFALFFATQQDGREAAIEELVSRHPVHAEAIRLLTEKLVAGAGVFASLGDNDDEIPAQIGSYKILDKLGEGGFGVVYLAEQSEPIRRRVALKCLLPGMDSRRVLARFEAERQALAMMNHANIAKVFDARGDDSGRPYFVMEYVPGESITDYCNGQRLSNRQRLELFVSVCDAVQHAHQKGVIHRDLKPSNVLVMEDEGKPVVKIIDFGVAKAVYQPLTMMTIFTAVGRMVGTPAYMSPEQTSPTPLDVDTRTDIYSLGVMLYELLTGRLPFDDAALRREGIEQIQKVVRETEPPRPSARVTSSHDTGELAALRRTQTSALIDELRGDLDWVVLRAMEKDRARRYDTARELGGDITRYLRHEPVEARPPQLSYVLRKFVRRNRTQVFAVAAVVVAVLVGLVFSLMFWLDARTNLDRYDRLADLLLVEWFQDESRKLWPEREERIPDMQEWLEKVRVLLARRPEHQRVFEEFCARKSVGDESGIPVFADKRDRFLYRSMSELLQKLSALEDPERGLIRAVENRLARAKTARADSIDAHRAKWDACIAAVAKDPRFKGLTLKPQVGLVPISPDPKTGLWEFAHLRTGEPAFREPDGGLMALEKNGLVFVLIPGGEFDMGSQCRDSGGPNYVSPRTITPYEQPLHRVRLEPFFLSKYEMTQAQWLRFTGINPSRFKQGKSTEGIQVNLLHPVESVSCNDAILVLSRLGLQLPTEAQWEYAARAGTTTPWVTGDAEESLKDKTNLCDEGSEAQYPGQTQKGFFDGFRVHAPIAQFVPNKFGLYDVAGNVSEWTSTWFKFYENPASPIQGERRESRGQAKLRMTRGGNFSTKAPYCRTALRSAHNPHDGVYNVGVRPARSIEN